MLIDFLHPWVARLPRFGVARSSGINNGISNRVSNWAGNWVVAEQGRFVLWLPVCVGMGALRYFAIDAEPSVWPAAVAALLGFAAACLARRWPVARALMVGGACAALGFAGARLAAEQAAPWLVLPRHAAQLEGRISALEFLPIGRRITLDGIMLDDLAVDRAIRVRLRDTDQTELAPGDAVRLRALLRPPPGPTYPGGWDMQREAYFTGMGGYGYALSPVERVRPASQTALRRLRAAIAARALTALPGTEGAIAATLLTGQASAIPAVDRAAFGASGLSHLLAVAGLHIGIVMALAFGAWRFALSRSEFVALHFPVRKIAAVVALATGFSYLVLTGGHVPIWRSFAMACLVTLALLTGRRAISMRSLALAACAVLLVAPWEILGVSFQMSFAAVLALIAGWELLRPYLAEFGAGAWWRRPVLYLAGLASTSVLAGTAVLPFSAYHFGSVALFYVPANLVAVPVTAFWVMPCGLAALALMPFGLDRIAFVPMGWGIGLIDAVARAVAAWPDAVLHVPQMPDWGLCCVTAGLIWLGLWRSQLRLAGMLPLMFGLASFWLVTPPDAVLTPDAAVIAVRTAGGAVIVQSPRAGGFELEVPQRVWGSLMQTPCRADSCDRDLPGGKLRVLHAGDPACGDVRVLLAPVALHGACPLALTVDRFTVLRQGAVAIWLPAGGPVLVTDRGLRGGRPWAIFSPERPVLKAAIAE